LRERHLSTFFFYNFILNSPVSNAWFTFDVTRPASCVHVAGNNPRNRATRKVLQRVISREEKNKKSVDNLFLGNLHSFLLFVVKEITFSFEFLSDLKRE